jgi:hypothetical protein
MKTLKALIAALLVLGAAGWARAAATLTISDGIDPTLTIADNTGGDNSPSTGILTVQTNIGVWFLTLETAITKPAIGSPTSPVLDLFIQADSSAAGNLTVTFSDNNFGSVNSSASANLTGFTFGIPSAPATVSYNAYSDSGNTVSAETTLITSFPTQPLSVNSSSFASLNLTAPSSITQDVQVNASGATSLDVDATVQLVPEPTVLSLGVFGLVGFAFVRAFRKHNMPSIR